MNIVDKTKENLILKGHAQGWSIRLTASKVGCSMNTVRKYWKLHSLQPVNTSEGLERYHERRKGKIIPEFNNTINFEHQIDKGCEVATKYLGFQSKCIDCPFEKCLE